MDMNNADDKVFKSFTLEELSEKIVEIYSASSLRDRMMGELSNELRKLSRYIDSLNKRIDTSKKLDEQSVYSKILQNIPLEILKEYCEDKEESNWLEDNE